MFKFDGHEMKNLLILLLVSVTLIMAGFKLYARGLVDGEQRYKRSHRMYMALKSAYHYGYMDGRDGRKEDWDGDDQ
jgi:hypothetical protein